MVAVVGPVGVWRGERGPRGATAPGRASAPADGAQLCVRPQLPLERQADGAKLVTVYGIGRRNTPAPFVAACDRFVYLDLLGKEQPESTPATPDGLPPLTIAIFTTSSSISLSVIAAR